MRKTYNSKTLKAVFGRTDLLGVEKPKLVASLWQYIQKKKLQDTKNKRNINADAPLKELFGRDVFNMFELVNLMNRLLTNLDKERIYEHPQQKRLHDLLIDGGITTFTQPLLDLFRENSWDSKEIQALSPALLRFGAFEVTINNEGELDFFEYFMSDRAQYYPETLECLESMGLKKLAKVFKEALALFASPVPRDSKDREEIVDALDEKGIQKMEQKLGNVDLHFTEMIAEKLAKIEEEYILLHWKEFEHYLK